MRDDAVAKDLTKEFIYEWKLTIESRVNLEQQSSDEEHYADAIHGSGSSDIIAKHRVNMK